MSLAAVEDALAARDHAAALGHALAFWRGCRRERVALLIDRLSAVVARTRPRPGGTSVDAKQAAWLALAANRDPGDLDGLLATLAEVRKAALLEARLAALAGRDDPRIGPAMHALLRHPPVPGATGIPVVERALELMIETGDPRSSVAFGELVRHVGTDGGGTAMWGLRQRLTSAGVRLRARLDAVATGIAAEDEARLDAIERRLDAQVRAHPQDPAALFAAVYANPDDDQARSVLADLLQEAGDPRGELIALQLARAAGGKRSKRESELLAAHAREWLGPIAPVVLKSGLVYERGFVARCRVTAEGIKHAERLVGAPEWCTVVEVDVSSWTRTPGPLLAGMPHLRVLRGLKFGSEMTSHPAIERLELAIFDRVDDFVRLELPALRALEIDSCFRTLEEMAPCWTAPVFAQLEVLAIQASPASIWLPAMARLGIPRVGYAYRSANPWRLWFEGEQVTAEYLWRSLSSDAGADLARLLELVPEPARRHLAIAQELPEGSVSASVLGRFASHRFAP